MSTKLIAFMPYLRVELPRCPPPLIELHLRDSMKQFFTDSQVWGSELDPMTIASGQTDYSLGPISGQAEIAAVKWAKHGQLTMTASVHYKLVNSKTELRLAWTPSTDSADALTICVALRPTLSADGLPDRIYSDWREVIVWGTLKVLLSMPAKHWSNPPLANLYNSKYEDRLTECRIEE